jgi:ATP-dependent helicase/nuclease subunit A
VLTQNVKGRDAADILDRFAARLDRLFKPRSILVETPFETINIHGQRTSGFIDLLLETDQGLVIIDHKSFLGASADWSAKALSYSGQLAAYCDSRRDLPIATAWIHFAAAGALLQIAW